MKVVITVTAVYDFPDDVELEDLIEGEDSLGQHIVVNGRKLQPVIDFLEYEGLEGGSHSWNDSDDEELEKVLDEVYDCLESEEYTLIPVDGFGDND
jgi:hypothetical protein